MHTETEDTTTPKFVPGQIWRMRCHSASCPALFRIAAVLDDSDLTHSEFNRLSERIFGLDNGGCFMAYMADGRFRLDSHTMYDLIELHTQLTHE